MTKMLPLLLLTGVLALTCTGCRKESGAPSLPPQEALSPKDELPRIRKAVRDFMREVAPESRVEGVWTLFAGSYALAGADVTTGRQRRTIDLLVRLYAREDGSEYWRAESLDGSFAALLSRPGSERQALPNVPPALE
jgi:hypothetical protein